MYLADFLMMYQKKSLLSFPHFIAKIKMYIGLICERQHRKKRNRLNFTTTYIERFFSIILRLIFLQTKHNNEAIISLSLCKTKWRERRKTTNTSLFRHCERHQPRGNPSLIIADYPQ
jgi:hypothetical protein